MRAYAVIIPAYNEAKYIAQVLQEVRHQRVLMGQGKSKVVCDLSIVVVDDGSRDNTVQLARHFTSHVLVHKVNLGKGAALKTGCEYAFHILNVDGVVLMDSDAQHDPVEIPRFLQKLEEGFDVCFGVRSLEKHMPKLKALSNRLVSYLTALFFGVYIPDIICGYKAFSHRGYNHLKWDARDYAVEMEIAARTAQQKLEFALLPIHTIYHDHQRGMTYLEFLTIMKQFLIWRFTL